MKGKCDCGEKNSYYELFRIMHTFKRLNFGAMLPDGLTQGEFGILSMVLHARPADGRDCITVSDIVNHVHVAPSAVSRSLKSLEEKGCIVRTVDTKDRRNTYVKLTEKGISYMKECEQIMREFSDAVFGGLGEANMEQLIFYMKKILELSEQEIAKRNYKTRKDEAENEKDI